MSSYDRKALRLDLMLSGIVLTMGVTIMGLSLAQLSSRDSQMAQVTGPLKTDPVPNATTPSTKDNHPADAVPGGTRPTTPAPEPARPGVDAQKSGATPALPAAPAEKMGEPVRK